MSYLIDLLKAAIIGIIDGIAQWLPVSANGHLVLFQAIWPTFPESFYQALLGAAALGCLLAVFFLYFDKLDVFSHLKSVKKRKQTVRLWICIITAALPLGIAGIALRRFVDQFLSAPFVIGVTLICYGIIFILISRNKPKPKIRSVAKINPAAALRIGLVQVLAVVPGTSRSAASIIGGLFNELSRIAAFEFSVLASMPILLMDGIWKLIYGAAAGNFYSLNQIGMLAAAMIAGFAISIPAIKGMYVHLQKHSFEIFGWYRVILGFLVLFFFYVLP